MKKENFNLGSITKKDIELIYKYDDSFDDMPNANKLLKAVEKKFNGISGHVSTNVAIVFAFKLGEMQGKRQERTKKGGVVNA